MKRYQKYCNICDKFFTIFKNLAEPFSLIYKVRIIENIMKYEICCNYLIEVLKNYENYKEYIEYTKEKKELKRRR